MSTIKIDPIPTWSGTARVITPQCDAKRTTRYANDWQTQNVVPEQRFRCALSSTFVVDGQHLCTRHASVYVLEAVLAENGHTQGVVR